MGSLMAAAAPVFLHYIGHTADGVEDVTSLLPLSVTQTKTVIDRAWEAAALEMAIAVWAIARRGIALSDLGEGPRRVYRVAASAAAHRRGGEAGVQHATDRRRGSRRRDAIGLRASADHHA